VNERCAGNLIIGVIGRDAVLEQSAIPASCRIGVAVQAGTVVKEWTQRRQICVLLELCSVVVHRRLIFVTVRLWWELKSGRSFGKSWRNRKIDGKRFPGATTENQEEKHAAQACSHFHLAPSPWDYSVHSLEGDGSHKGYQYVHYDQQAIWAGA
jgi:hypothetical protein